MSDQVDDDHWIWLPPEELTRLQREKTQQMRAVLDRLMAPPTELASSTPSPLLAAPYPDEQQQPYSGPNHGPSRTDPDR